MNVTRGELMTVEHRARFRAAGVEAESLDATTWRVVTDPLPEWLARGRQRSVLR